MENELTELLLQLKDLSSSSKEIARIKTELSITLSSVKKDLESANLGLNTTEKNINKSVDSLTVSIDAIAGRLNDVTDRIKNLNASIANTVITLSNIEEKYKEMVNMAERMDENIVSAATYHKESKESNERIRDIEEQIELKLLKIEEDDNRSKEVFGQAIKDINDRLVKISENYIELKNDDEYIKQTLDKISQNLSK